MNISFLHNNNSATIEAFGSGIINCNACGHSASLETLNPLEMVNCSSCSSPIFVPQKIGKFWLYFPIINESTTALYKAYHEDFPYRFFSVKILPRDQRENSDLIKKLEKEADLVYKLGKHPCLFTGVESGYEDGEHYLAMEFHDGERLDKCFDEQGTLTEVDVLIIALRLLSAETHIYNRGYLYRDLKPENILIFPPEGAFLYGYEHCQTLKSICEATHEPDGGLQYYVSPERFLGETEGLPSEIYSLGMLLYHLLAGTPYFSEEELKKLAIRLRGEYLTLSKTQDKMKVISSDIADIITKMIRRSPEQRYQNFYEVEVDMIEALNKRF